MMINFQRSWQWYIARKSLVQACQGMWQKHCSFSSHCAALLRHNRAAIARGLCRSEATYCTELVGDSFDQRAKLSELPQVRGTPALMSEGDWCWNVQPSRCTSRGPFHWSRAIGSPRCHSGRRARPPDKSEISVETRGFEPSHLCVSV